MTVTAHANGTAHPKLRPTATQDRIAALADAMRGFLEDPGSPDAQLKLAEVKRGCTDGEFEAAWGLVSPDVTRRYEGPPPGARLLPVVTLSRQDPPPAATPALRRSRWRAVDGDTVITWSMAATVALVAVDAAIVSYSHIYGLAAGQQGSGVETGVQARLLPLSIDGVIAEASLVLLYAARHKLTAPRLARCMLLLGIVATVAANVAHGLPSALLNRDTHIVISALLSAWPAGAFIGSVEMAMGLVRAIRAVEAGDGDSDTSGDTEDDNDSDADRDNDDGQDAGGGDKDDDKDDDKKLPRRRGTDPVKAAIKKGWDDDKIIAKLGVTKRTIQRHRRDIKAEEEATRNATG